MITIGIPYEGLPFFRKAKECVMNRVWLVEFEDNCASKNKEEVRTEY